MSWWRLIRQFPKFMLVAAVLTTSTVLFAFWWLNHSPKRDAQLQADTASKVAQIAANWGQLILADNDLYDITNGKLIFQNWLEKGMPQRLFWEAPSKTVLAQYELGFIRYSLDGRVMTSMLRKYPFALTDDYKSIIYAKEKDIWRAEIDWQELKPINEKRVTSIEQFLEPFFAENIVLGTEKTLLVRNLMKLLRVNLETGDVHPIAMPNINLARHRSPDSKTIAGMQNGELFCYDVDTDSVRASKIGRVSMTDFQWLDNDRAACILNQKLVALYDRAANTLTEVCQLPFPCFKVGEVSPTTRYFFCANYKQGVLIDLEKKTATPITGGAGIAWVSDDTLAFSREAQNSNLRGTWLKKVGEEERRVTPEPYLVVKSGPMLLGLNNLDLVVFATNHGISTLTTKGTIYAVTTLSYSLSKIKGFEQKIFRVD